MKPLKHILYIILFCTHFAGAIAEVYDDVKLVPNPKTAEKNAFVSNPDGILSSETVDLLNAQLYELEKEKSAEVAIVAVNSIGNQEIEDFANSLFNHWGIGKSGNDNGVLILFVLDQRAIRIEVGYGLEGALPDALCKRIQMQAMIPEFKNEKYDVGILSGVEMMIKIINNEPVPELESDKDNSDFFIGTVIILFVLFGLFPLLWLNYKSKKISSNEKYQTNASRYAAFKSNKNAVLGCSSFLLFPIFFFAVFVAIFASWKVLLVVFIPFLCTIIPVNIWAKRKMKKIRQAPIPCNLCGGMMHILPKTAGNNSLNPSQQMEIQLHSADYDVFRCVNCQKENVFKIDLPSKYTVCSNCGTKSFVKKSKKTITRPTYTSSGAMEVEYACLFCQHTETKLESIPRLQYSSSGGSSGGSSSSSGGSFGGGRSGGGGSTSRW